MSLRIQGISTDECEAIWRGGADSNGQTALVRVAEGLSNPCRHCLGLIHDGDQKLVLAYRPFDELQPYAETGPIFLHATPCVRYESDALPLWFDHLTPAIVRGYGEDHWIRYDTGHVVAGNAITQTCETILQDSTVAYVHVRSKFNCFQCRVDRA
jgi:hypothetical protein